MQIFSFVKVGNGVCQVKKSYARLKTVHTSFTEYLRINKFKIFKDIYANFLYLSNSIVASI